MTAATNLKLLIVDCNRSRAETKDLKLERASKPDVRSFTPISQTPSMR